MKSYLQHSSLLIVLGILFLAVATPAIALPPLCSLASAPSDFSVDSIQVRPAGESEFQEITTDNFCYVPYALTLAGGDTHKIYYITLSTSVTTLEPSYPEGTEFKVEITNLATDYSLGFVDSIGGATRAIYGADTGGDPDKLTLVVSSLTRDQSTGSDAAIPYCTRTIFLQTPSPYISIHAIKKGIKSSQLEHAIQASYPGSSEIPEIFFDSEAVQFSLRYEFQGCQSSVHSYDAAFDSFLPLDALARGGLSKALLDSLTDEILLLLFTPTAGTGFSVSNFSVRKSFGDRQSQDGTDTSTDLQGLVVRMEVKNDGWGYTCKLPACTSSQSKSGSAAKVHAAAKAGGFRIKSSSQAAIKACTSRKKPKKGYVLKKKGSKISCQRKRGKK